MAKILILAASGFGKSTSIGKNPELNITGLNPEDTFIISCTSKPLPFRGSDKIYKICPKGVVPTKETGNRVICNEGSKIGNIIKYIVRERKDIKNLVLDDSNYIMQDYFMANSEKKGYDTFKAIGKSMDDVFSAMEEAQHLNIFMMAHYEEFKDSSLDTLSYRFKTVGKMVQDYITPEGKFDIVLYGKQNFNQQDKRVEKKFVTNYDGQFPAKSPHGMFNIEIPNDLDIVLKGIQKYYN